MNRPPTPYESAAATHYWHRFWRWFALLALMIFTVVALLVVVPSFLGYGPLASQPHAQTFHLVTTRADRNVSRQQTHYLQAQTTSEAIRSIALLASLLPETETTKEAAKLFSSLLRNTGVPALQHFSGAIGDALARRVVGSKGKPVDPKLLLHITNTIVQEGPYDAGVRNAFMWFNRTWGRDDRVAFEHEADKHGSHVIKIYTSHKAIRQVLGIAS